MNCSPQAHLCRWRGSARQVEAILTRYMSGTSEQALATEHQSDVAEILAIVRAHAIVRREPGTRVVPRVPRRASAAEPGTCSTGWHTCLWATNGTLVDQLIRHYQDGDSLNDLAQHFPYYSRATVGRILAAHAIPRRTRAEQCTRIQLDLDAIRRSLEEGVPLRTIASQHRVSRQWLRKRLDRALDAA